MKQSQNNKYKTILADPPWDINQKGKREPHATIRL